MKKGWLAGAGRVSALFFRHFIRDGLFSSRPHIQRARRLQEVSGLRIAKGPTIFLAPVHLADLNRFAFNRRV